MSEDGEVKDIEDRLRLDGIGIGIKEERNRGWF